MARGRPKKTANLESQVVTAEEFELGAKPNGGLVTISAYENKSITFQGDIKGYNYDTILKNKQDNIYKLFELSDYFVDADSLFGGLIKRVLVPFAVSCGWQLTGVSESVKERYRLMYEQTGFRDKMRNIFYEYFTFDNCYVYFMDDGHLITLPQHRIRISDMTYNGEPVLEFNIQELGKSQSGTKASEKFLETLVEKYKGYPSEIQEAVKGAKTQWVQLNPENTYALQGFKSDWQKYAIPMVASCLKAFAKKALIENFEKSQLNIGARGFLHARIGDKDLLNKVNVNQLNAIADVFKNALNGFPLAVTAWNVDAEWKSVDSSKTLFDKSKYNEVNAEILAAGGISSIVVSGQGDSGSSFAQAQISIQTAAERIKQYQDNFSEMMKKYNTKLAGTLKATSNRVPEFKFYQIDLQNDEKFKDATFKLYSQGLVSKQTTVETYGFDFDQEIERRKKESKEIDTVMMPPVNPHTQPSGSENTDGGRPTIPDSNKKGNPNNSKTGKQPKPSGN